MRKPKKLTALLLALTLLFACAACANGNSTTDSGKTISGTLPEIIDRLYDTVDVDDEQRDFLKNSVGTVEIPKDQSAYYFGVETSILKKPSRASRSSTPSRFPFASCVSRTVPTSTS